MTHRRSTCGASLGGAFALVALANIAHADPVVCQKQVIKKLASFKKISLTATEKCLDKENEGKLPGPCPDTASLLKIQKKSVSATDKISTSCTMADLAALGFPGNCQFEAATQGNEGQCAALPVTTPAELSACLQCWKAAEASEFVAILYASHALEVCGGSLGESSPNCSDLDFTSPLPIQRNLGDTGENDCQIGIGKAGVKYLVTREKTLEKCGLAGGTRASCLADLTIQEKLQKAETKKQVLVKNKCGNRDPVPNPPFCCRTNPMMQACVAAASRDDCTMNLGGDVIEGKTCVSGSCQSTMGMQVVTWWGVCPETGTALATQADLVACVDASADQIVDELLCLQFRGNGGADWPCPPADGSPSGAFLDSAR
jgi:hypothetical protein